MLIEQVKLVSNNILARGIYAMELSAPGIAQSIQPGQFVNVLINATWSPLLRRPMSVASRQGDRIGLIYKVFGSGTATMAGWLPGQQVDLLGPLGNGWSVVDGSYPVLVGGGVGIAPILFLHDALDQAGREHDLIMGARDGEEHFLTHAPERHITLTTDNGTAGLEGTVVDGLKQVLNQVGSDTVTIFGCGPAPMLTALKDFANAHQLPCQLALEEMMGCGFGICQGCSVELKTKFGKDQPSYRERFQLVCLDGPVFWAHQLV